MALLAPMEILRDGEFSSLGLLSDDSPGLLVALYDGKAARRGLLPNRHVAGVITTPELAPAVPPRIGLAVAPDPLARFYQIHEYLLGSTSFYWQDFPTEISPDARVDPSARVAPRNVRIGRGTVLEPGVTVLEHCLLGDDVVLRAGCVIGAAGFAPQTIGGVVRMIPHAGGVALHDGVEVQANTVICRCVFGGFTQVGEDTKISNLVNISHNVRIGRRCRVGAAANIMGSARLGDDIWVGPNATVSNRLHIGDRARISLGAVVVRDVPAGGQVSGNFAVDHRRFLRYFRDLLRT